MNMKKIVASAAALSLTAAVAVGGTLAWLSNSSELKVNKFTYAFGGDQDPIELTLTETFEENAAVTPGAEIDKVPVLTVEKGSVDCYVYAKIDNKFGDSVAALDIDTANWTLVGGTENIYRYKEAVSAADAAVALPELFTTVTFSSSLTNDTLKDMVGDDGKTLEATIDIQGYAIQSTGVDEEGTTMNTDIADEQAIAFFNPSVGA